MDLPADFTIKFEDNAGEYNLKYKFLDWIHIFNKFQLRS